MRPSVSRLLLLVVIATLGLASCGDQSRGNPILGKWILDEERMEPRTAQSAKFSIFADGIEFHEEKAIFGSNARDVAYEFDGDSIIVTAQDGQGSVFTLTEDDRLLFEGPPGTLVLRRVE